jgi:hypothetical protein
MSHPSSPHHPLCLQFQGQEVCRVLSAQGVCVGHFKRIQGVWKFKALGQDAQGHTVPGGGPLTHRHNTVLTDLDSDAVNAALR